MRPTARAALAACLVTFTAGCGASPDGAAGSLSAEGVAACASQLFWATGADRSGDGTGVDVTVERAGWLKPTSGPSVVPLSFRGGQLPPGDWSLPRFLVVVPDHRTGGDPYALGAERGGDEIARAAGTAKPCPRAY